MSTPYSEARSLIQTGDVLTFAGDWLFSRLIRWYTQQAVSHAGMAVWLRLGGEDRDRLCLLEALEGHGIRLVPLSHALTGYYARDCPVYWQKNLTSGSKCLTWALAQWGKRYASKLQFLSLLSPRYQRCRQWLRLPPKPGHDQYHCAELVARSLQESGYHHPKPPEFTTPGDLWDFACLSFPEQLTDE